MNILFLDQYSEPGGGQAALLDILPAMSQRGWSACVGLPGDGVVAERARAYGASVEVIPSPALSSGRKSLADAVHFARTFLRQANHMKQAADKHNADLIYVNGPRALPAAAWAFRKRPHLLFHCHARLTHPYDAGLAKWAIRRSRATVVSCCRFAVEPLLRDVSPAPATIIPCGVRAGAPAGVPGSTGTWRIGVIGRISPEKGQAEFLRAARLLLPQVPNCRFVICGAPLFSDPEAARYHATVQELARGLPVDFLGWQNNVSGLFAGLDLLVVPSIREPGLPRVILEAYAAAVPVVAFASGGIPEAVRDGDTGFLVEPRTPEALARTMRQLILDYPDKLRAVARAGHAVWKRDYTLELYQARIAAIIQSATERRN
ncbi:MAG: glycosyltransferase family 4 protein [Acidobacteriales bacterium]|nr:glycosyltransferase family 4 protein [Terriglobales bacterium]